MIQKKNLLAWAAGLLLAAVAGLASAENVQDFGEYVVHYNAINTDMLSPQVAQEYGIKRSKNRGMLNVVVLKKVLGATGQPVHARISGHSMSLTGKQHKLAFREIQEGNAIYSIAEFAVNNEEALTFTVEVIPEDSDEPLTVKFRKQFFTR